ncbi:hypothetical protein LJC07_06815 [Christensenellaceae bacterium OttesenSCG-928-L17]|nr:hypothetical protein [Christensenellaceae bacterium OttesenSCG-928-L17]
MVVPIFAGMQDIIGAFRSVGLLHSGYHIDLLRAGYTSNLALLALPILCTLPYTTAYVEDKSSGFLKAYLPKVGVQKYIAQKAGACALSGGLCLLFGALMAYILLALCFLPKEAAGRLEPTHIKRMLEQFALLFAFGAFWSSLGFLLASLTKSRYMAYAGPFVICYVCIIFYERYFNKLYVLYPKEWLSPSNNWVMGAWGVVLLLIVFSVAIMSVFALFLQRKLVEA